jgi:CDP-glycerol glycerophosphotransferase (TagB/SpsB family)
MLAAGVITPDNHAIIGYPKFDTIAFGSPPPRLFANDRPTVLYNPHFDPALSSWYDWAQRIIDWFAGQSRFNLVVAPHVMLFQRRWHASVEHRRVRRRRDLPTLATDHIIIDPGSSRSVDMSYTRAADIYLGDASSQIYEWIVRPRPAIFLNPSHVAWLGDANFAHWRLGEVIDRLDQLPAALARAVDHPDAFRAQQEAALASTFSVTDEPAARRAARAIMERFG